MNKKWQSLFVLLCLFILSGCAKREVQDESVDEVELSVQEETISENPRYIYSGIQGSDETGIASYNLLPEKSEVEIGLAGDTKEEWRTYTAELISFRDLDNGVEFVYMNEEGEEIAKHFEILSDSIVIDEEKNRYEWM